MSIFDFISNLTVHQFIVIVICFGLVSLIARRAHEACLYHLSWTEKE